jgi:hypothetical protein
MAHDGSPRRTSLVFPILLITVGALYLYANWRPAFDPWPILETYWPLILIFIGLGKIWDNTRRSKDPNASGGLSVGATLGTLAFVFVVIVLLWHGHGFAHRHGAGYSIEHQSKTVERQGAKFVRAAIEMGAGDLFLSGGSNNLLEASFDYRASSGAPRVDYHVDGGTGDLTITESSSKTHVVIGPSSDNDWNLRLSNEVPVELKIDMGAGRGTLRLRELNLTRLQLNMGAGRIDVDLTGDRKQDLQGDIEGGVGEANIRLPKDVGVVVNASGGIGTIDAHGLKHNGDEYTNEAYGKSPATIHLKVEGGIGRINLTQEP